MPKSDWKMHQLDYSEKNSKDEDTSLNNALQI